MTDREKLIELLEEASEKMDCPQMHQIADYLISNGVTVSPVPVGSTVYALYNRNKSRHGVLGNRTHTRNSQIVTNGSLESAKIGGGNIEIRAKKANKQDALLLGRLVFLTREEAERMIANG